MYINNQRFLVHVLCAMTERKRGTTAWLGCFLASSFELRPVSPFTHVKPWLFAFTCGPFGLWLLAGDLLDVMLDASDDTQHNSLCITATGLAFIL